MYLFSYTITISGGSAQQTISHNDVSSSRILTTWSRLNPGETYTFTITCELQGEDCEGDPVTFTATTLSCSG